MKQYCQRTWPLFQSALESSSYVPRDLWPMANVHMRRMVRGHSGRHTLHAMLLILRIAALFIATINL